MNIAIIAAGGRGARMGAIGRAKQFLEISGIPIIVHTLLRFESCAEVAETIVVAPADDVEAFPKFAEQFGLKKLARVVAGGKTRTQSVWRGLQSLRADASTVVAVHDAVRPFVTSEEIASVFREAKKSGAAILAARVVDTVKEADGKVVTRTLERSRLWHAQTPQCFRYELLFRAYSSAIEESIEATDDSALVERLGVQVSIVEGGANNIKITTPRDLALAEILFNSQ